MLRVNIVGIGPGNPKLLTGAAFEAINQSTILIGDKRMLANFASEKRFYDTIKTEEICNICANANPEKDIVSILVSGDVGFFSLAKTISGKLPDCECVRFCGISSLVYFAHIMKKYLPLPAEKIRRRLCAPNCAVSGLAACRFI